MTNSFPAAASDFALSQLSYQATLPAPSLQSDAGMQFGDGVTTQLVYNVPVLGMVFSFSVPGEFGAFDQSPVEAGLMQAVGGVLEVLAAMSGMAPASLAAGVQIERGWTFTSLSSGTGYMTSDTIPYTPPG